MRFLGLGLADTVPDANTIWTFREALTRSQIANKPAIMVLSKRFDAALAAAGFPPNLVISSVRPSGRSRQNAAYRNQR
jgi:Transposase domain (DUF772)